MLPGGSTLLSHSTALAEAAGVTLQLGRQLPACPGSDFHAVLLWVCRLHAWELGVEDEGPLMLSWGQVPRLSRSDSATKPFAERLTWMWSSCWATCFTRTAVTGWRAKSQLPSQSADGALHRP